MDSEITAKTEWTCFNDDRITSVDDNWLGVIDQCVQLACWPSVLFYEKLDSEEQYNFSKGFKLT